MTFNLLKRDQSNFVPIDFEYNNSNEKYINLVCCSMLVEGNVEEYWLHDDPQEKIRLKTRLEGLKNKIFIAYGATAECRAFRSLGLEPLDFKWIDLHFEYKQIQYCDQRYLFGKFYLHTKSKGWVLRESTAQKFYSRGEKYWCPEMREYVWRDKFDIIPCNLINALYCLCGIKSDPYEKDEMRSLVLSSTSFSQEEKVRLMKYCSSDIKDLLTLTDKISYILWDKYTHTILNPNETNLNLLNLMLKKGSYSASLSWVEEVGYPIDEDMLLTFKNNVPQFFAEIKKEIDKLIPGYIEYSESKAGQGQLIPYTIKYCVLEKWIEDNNLSEKWPKVKSAYKPNFLRGKDPYKNPNKETKLKYSTKKEDLKPLRSDDRVNTLREFLKSYQMLRNFTNKKSWDSFRENKGSDGRYRIFWNGYGSLTTRNQPPARELIMLWPKFARNMLREKGKSVISLDYKSQEVLVAALLSEDNVLLEHYLSGDIYLSFAKHIGLAPQDATKDSHSNIRDICKQIILGLQYGMGSVTLAKSLEPICKMSMAEIVNIVNKHKKTYKKYWEYNSKIKEDYGTINSRYRVFKSPVLRDGCTVGPHSKSVNTIGNFPIQGNSAYIMRKVVYKCAKNKYPLCILLHDGFYFIVDEDKAEELAPLYLKAMAEAFKEVFAMERELNYKFIDQKIIKFDKTDEDEYDDYKTFKKYGDYFTKNLTKEKTNV